MAKTAAERKRLSRERQREGLKVSPELTADVLRRPFFEFVNDDPNWSDVQIAFHLAGLAPPVFENDQGPIFPPDLEGLDVPTTFEKSIGRAELMVSSLISAATGLAGIINEYKRQEIERHEQRIEAKLAHPGGPDRKAAIDELVRLSKLRDRLSKQTRVSLPTYELKGE